MSFNDISKKADAKILGKLGEPAIYTPKATGVLINTSVIVDHDIEVFPGGLDSSVTATQTEMDLLYADVPNPKKGDTVSMGGETFTVDDLLPGGNDRSMVRVVVK